MIGIVLIGSQSIRGERFDRLECLQYEMKKGLGLLTVVSIYSDRKEASSPTLEKILVQKLIKEYIRRSKASLTQRL